MFGLIIWGGCIIVLNNYFGQSGSSFIDVYTHPFTFEFIIGVLMAHIFYKHPSFGHAKLFTLLAFLAWFLSYYFVHAFIDNATPKGWTRILVYGGPAILTLYAALLLEIKNKIVMPGWLRSIGNASYSIYLSHVIVLSVIGRIWATFAIEGNMDNIVMLVVMIVAVLIAGFLSYHLIEKKLLYMTTKFGEKRLIAKA